MCWYERCHVHVTSGVKERCRWTIRTVYGVPQLQTGELIASLALHASVGSVHGLLRSFLVILQAAQIPAQFQERECGRRLSFRSRAKLEDWPSRCQMIMTCRARESQVFAVPGTEMPSTAIAEHDDHQDREMR
jgi:hypothetical protein